ncbi:glycosyl transferase family group 2-domain-containing protein [Blyttiomyces helicus]|uniref:Glycosyl transferase family group 2-domain-containing protein n=1 Tax=Blyttiomyces helicus TaxID=388810 RepID=A0A4P9WD96_9FUNG|nr:glycosyl transferase family group 2-domain-containing protein [Blyttiomyces helicus]|eukprot:RKO89675.1 glycosyl transferase family group 2-domain-containing protein [Blyttiomyces helicus]
MPPQPAFRGWDGDRESDSDTGTLADDTPESKAGPAANPHVPGGVSYALLEDSAVRTNLGNTKFIMALLSEMWIFHMCFILGFNYCLTFLMPVAYTGYTDDVMWNWSCYWKMGWLLPLPYTLICFFGLALPFRTPKFIYSPDMPKRRVDNLYILTVTKGDNREAVYRAWNAHKHLERLHPCVRVHVLTDEPYFFENLNCYTCPKSFRTANSKYKARALEWYRQTMRYTEHDWILHLDEESVIDDESVKRVLEFIWFEKECTWGQGVIMYNQYKYWKNWFFTVADAIRVGDDLSRFALQYTYFRMPVFGAHGSFLLTNGAVENSVTWDLGSLTEDYQFAMHAWDMGYKCGKVPGIIREQSPMDLIGFLKQRRRWYVGIRRLPNFLPKLWNFFWTLGIITLFCTLASFPLGAIYHEKTPRWFGLMKDFSFAVFVYLYLVGILVQDMDKKVNPLITLIRIPITFVLQFVAGAMEAAAVIYGLLMPPADFDVIKK